MPEMMKPFKNLERKKQIKKDSADSNQEIEELADILNKIRLGLKTNTKSKAIKNKLGIKNK